MKLSALLGCGAILLANTAMAAPDQALLIHKPAQRFITGAPSGSKTLDDQNRDDAGIGIISQNTGASSPQAADDFTVPNGHTWQVNEVDVTGVYYNGSGPADSENVFFYEDNNGLPGKAVASCPNQNGTGNGTGSFAIKLSKSCKVKLGGDSDAQAGKKSKGTTYWVSVQVNMDVQTHGQWGWELTSDKIGNQAAYQNPGAQSCSTWGSFQTCFGQPGYLMFALKGKDKH